MSAYGTDAAFQTYAAARGNTTVAAATEANRDAARLRASEFIDGRYGSAFPGYRSGGRDQVRQWPRSFATDSEGWTIQGDQVPEEVERATYEAAIRELATPGGLTPDVTLSTRVKSTTEKVGPLSESVEYMSGTGGVSDLMPVLTILDDILGRLISVNPIASEMTRV